MLLHRRVEQHHKYLTEINDYLFESHSLCPSTVWNLRPGVISEKLDNGQFQQSNGKYLLIILWYNQAVQLAGNKCPLFFVGCQSQDIYWILGLCISFLRKISRAAAEILLAPLKYQDDHFIRPFQEIDFWW